MRKFLSLTFLCLIPTINLLAQRPANDAAANPTVQHQDTSISPFVKKVLDAAEKDKQESQTTFRNGRIAIKQRAIWELLSKTAQDVKLYLDRDINLKAVTKELESVKTSYAIAQDGIFINKGTAQTERNLSVSSAITEQLILQTENRKKQIDKYTHDLIQYRDRIDSLLSDPVIYAFPKDSVSLSKYLLRLRIIVEEANPSDNALNESLDAAQTLQNEVDNLLFTLKHAREKIESFRNQLSNINFKREFADIWDTAVYHRPFEEIIKFSVAKEKLALSFYIRENILNAIVLFLLIGLTFYAIRSLKKKLSDGNHAEIDVQKTLIIKRPLAAAFLIVLSTYQFAFINAPFIFSFCIWSAEVVCLYLLLRRFITTFWFRFWIVLSLLFLMACADNFILQASRPERWIIIALSLTGSVYGFLISINKHRNELREGSILIFIRIFSLVEFIAFIANLFGRFNLSKSFMVAGYTGVTTAILFIWVVRLINEGLSLGAIIYKHPDGKSFYLNLNRVGHKAPKSLYVMLVIGWLVIVGRNFYAFKKIAVRFQQFLHEERSVGDYSFSINSLVLFLLITFCSLALSKIISFFTADPKAIHGSNQHAKGVTPGSWILLIRIFIISAGLFLAFAASGIALDKITIVLGALSVGIGLGLQGLVSNLVSGLIIAFERPVNVGDVIELNGKPGTMKSIGFRSSIITLTDGSSLVVPNVDLLNDHVINWSLSRSNKRLNIPVNVAYGSDLKQVKSVLEGLAEQNIRIVKYPAAYASAKAFNEHAVGFEMVFWIKNPSEATVILGDMITAIDIAFKEAGITIPLPQQELHILADKRKDEDQHPELD